jgi:hypothetical protein
MIWQFEKSPDCTRKKADYWQILQQLAGAVPMVYMMGDQPVRVTAHFGHAFKIQIRIRPAFQPASHAPPQVTGLF